ncbi:hypothetical protein AQ938_06945 [Burkholderia pseudomallei]|uniref:hypothetical protein n=1 Tax=Burkholderia pseudomallei TaxID=28450 RepID=UPI00015F7D18|nr:hypothetical protein [Burkholderia pseudomallei]AJX60658.1 hypothetical protein DP47_3377 [Burkholderia pseudomallei Pasteur 52237]EDO95506.1 hypothetical protein BURPSPAST_C1341 [Burkholderia pseudomallei Pasteur 52237]MWA16583.1 hypothetical protein [Burkholderia pseudomallei]OND79009.1 hypothetical protein AQ938_06945 [Burkholderia pseudomallei]VBQ80939.1 Uncharacterised protein [Burkholderia pseudomallei]
MAAGQAQMMDLSAAADYLGTGAIEIPIFEREIMDVVRRTSVALNRIEQVPATGHPHRYFEQTAIGQAAAVDPRNLSSTATGPTRVERPAFIKAVTNQSNLSLFDKDVTEQQGQFASVVARDVDDIINAIEIKRASMLWVGTDTSLSAPTTLEWMGGLAQITQTATVAPGASIIDALKAQVAAMVANVTYVVRPTAVYLNPVLADYIDQEAKASRITLDSMEVTAGVTVTAISTQAGKLPLIGDPFMPADTAAKYGFSAPPAGNKNYYAVIMSEKDVEIPVISGREFNKNPRLFQLGLTGNLAGQFVGVKFDAVIFKGASYAHTVLAVQRP